ncbi:uncharacterized protein LOC142523292 [Primulina tabacum]|uniref:uncharacterized protein LOC142523292 n=1 Tax=Primulina tabacum TaxID=48773 RepID=UPI003F592F46
MIIVVTDNSLRLKSHLAAHCRLSVYEIVSMSTSGTKTDGNDVQLNSNATPIELLNEQSIDDQTKLGHNDDCNVNVNQDAATNAAHYRPISQKGTAGGDFRKPRASYASLFKNNRMAKVNYKLDFMETGDGEKIYTSKHMIVDGLYSPFLAKKLKREY